ncbi:MAG: acyltransferase [Lachnospiraceae bacterium]|jgi:peptidoglycan/LPS O-acetylase OafA/YrhL|nr:acyltransferase [Lachnospiraceae bacterium]
MNKYNSMQINVDDNCFDYMRIICAITIFLGHFITHFDYQSVLLNNIAYFIRGVPVFFCLSGFFCTRSIEKYGRKEFLKKRFFRLYPALWVCIIINTIIIVFTYSVSPSIKDGIVYGVTQLTFFQFYTGDWLRGYGVGAPNGALWTISTEIQFYLVLIIFAFAMKKWSIKVWTAIIALTAMVSWVFGQYENLFPEIVNKCMRVSVVPFLYIFLFGMMCYEHRETLIPIFLYIRIPALLVYLVWNFLPENFKSFAGGVRYNIITTLLLMICVISFGFSFGKHRVKREWSYHFYLYHMVVINFFVQMVTNKVGTITELIILLLATFLITLVFMWFSGSVVDGKLSVIFHHSQVDNKR